MDAAGEQRRQLERNNALRDRQERGVDIKPDAARPAPLARLPADETPCFAITQIQLRGPDATKFGWLLSSFAGPAADDLPQGKCLGAQGINVLLQRAQDALIGRGFVTSRVLAEPQDLTSGQLLITVFAGRIASIRFTDGTSYRGTARNALPINAGDILNLRDIEQGLENLQRVPTVSADIKIAPADGEGAAPGQSDLQIDWTQRSPVRASVTLDDAGSRGTGKLQANATLSLDNPLGLNELFYISAGRGVFNGRGKDTNSWTAHYDVPYGYWLFGATASAYDYSQNVVGAFESYDYSGRSQNAEARVDRLLLRNAKVKFSAYARGWQRESKNYIDDTEIEVQRRRTAGWELGLTHKQFIGNATLDASVAYRRGTGAFHALRSPEEMAQQWDPTLPLEGTSRMKLITADAQFSVPFQLGRQRLRYTAAWRAQWNRTPLSPQDRFAIGGRYTVRGFDGESSLSGERGWSLRNDLSLGIGGGQEFYVAADYGRIGGPSAQWQSGRDLAGMALGLRGGWQQLSWDGFVGSALHKPAHFPTDYTTFGFSLAWRY
ncbi:ShlB/FhaC/HecB family hemolysin secretion/activation protein [Stenotrophomonas sp.]|uniref:ShlB/FhaC/HecB family hemolysin secretion/activation protein n=1 Tax=Stenotrophomonas sp. TaxID=69392 RepID=UPI00374CFA92